MKKGFTLIELLAVIVILAIVALIATPLILNVIEDTKKGAFKNSAHGIIEAGEFAFAKDVMKGSSDLITFGYNEGVEIPNVEGNKLEYKGSKPKDGLVVINSQGQIALAIHDGKYCVEKDYEESKVNLSEKTITDCLSNLAYDEYPNGTIIYFNPNTGTICDESSAVSTTGTKEGCMKWYTFNDSKFSPTVNLILDHNTTVNEFFDHTCEVHLEGGQFEKVLKEDTSTWLKSLKPRAITAEEIAMIVGRKGWLSEFDTTTLYFDSLSDTASPTCQLGETSDCQYGWLYDRMDVDCENYGCLNNGDVETYGYWTTTFKDDEYVWSVGGTFLWAFHKTTNVFGIRPAITISKSLIPQ